MTVCGCSGVESDAVDQVSVRVMLKIFTTVRENTFSGLGEKERRGFEAVGGIICLRTKECGQYGRTGESSAEDPHTCLVVTF